VGCRQGHDFAVTGVYELKRANGRIERRCKPCYDERSRASRERTKDERNARLRARAAAVDKTAEMPLCKCGSGKRAMPSTMRSINSGGKCSDCHYVRLKRYWDTEKGLKVRQESALRTRNKLRDELLAAYGGMCSCCGEDIRAFLTIDHINNDGGGRDRERTGAMLWCWLRQQGWPTDNYRLLCFNCNTGRHINGGICPHQERNTE
jgi:hypothetical protein